MVILNRRAIKHTKFTYNIFKKRLKIFFWKDITES